jgi:hypothetical protein
VGVRDGVYLKYHKKFNSSLIFKKYFQYSHVLYFAKSNMNPEWQNSDEAGGKANCSRSVRCVIYVTNLTQTASNDWERDWKIPITFDFFKV